MYKWLSKILPSFDKTAAIFSGHLLLKRSFTILLIQFTGLALAFLSNVLLARLYGEEVYGLYSLLTSWASFLVVIAVFGMDDSHLVSLPSLKLQGKKKSILEQLRWSLFVNFFSISLVIALAYLVVNFFHIPGLSEHAYYFNYSLIIVCLLALSTNFICFLRGLDQVIAGEIIDKIFRPFFFLALLLLFFYYLKTDSLVKVILANGAGLLGVGMLLLIRIGFFFKKYEAGTDPEKKRFQIAPNIRYVLLNVLYILSIRIDILLLGLLSAPVEVGHYNVAIRFADIFAYPIAIINLSLPTLLSTERHHKGEMATPKMMYSISKNTFFQCLILDILFLVTGNWLLSWYGKGFTGAFPVLCLFLLSNLVSAATGSMDVFFIMQAQEKKVIYCRIFSLSTTLVLALFLIPAFGIMGAAAASLAGNLCYCSLLQYFFYKRYGMFIHPFARKI
jgi:O-antigen/teichoic acid export membrane protein